MSGSEGVAQVTAEAAWPLVRWAHPPTSRPVLGASMARGRPPYTGGRPRALGGVEKGVQGGAPLLSLPSPDGQQPAASSHGARPPSLPSCPPSLPRQPCQAAPLLTPNPFGDPSSLSRAFLPPLFFSPGGAFPWDPMHGRPSPSPALAGRWHPLKKGPLGDLGANRCAGAAPRGSAPGTRRMLGPRRVPP